MKMSSWETVIQDRRGWLDDPSELQGHLKYVRSKHIFQSIIIQLSTKYNNLFNNVFRMTWYDINYMILTTGFFHFGVKDLNITVSFYNAIRP